MAGSFLALSLGKDEPAKVERLSPEIDQLIPTDAKLETLATGYKWTEGPVWIQQGGYLLFAEIPSNRILKMTPGEKPTVFMHPSGYKGKTPYGGPEPGSNGMTLDKSGRLTVAGHAQRDVWRLESLTSHTQMTILVQSYQGKPLNSPNDLVYRSDGSLYFTDPPYGLPTQSEHDPLRQLDVNGVYRLPGAYQMKPGAAPANDKLELLVTDLTRPNGIAFSPDEQYLYVNNSEPKKLWMKYRVQADGKLTDGKLFFDATDDKRKGLPDGMKVDMSGNVYSAGPGGIWIFSPEGKHLGTVDLPDATGNLAWGDEDWKTLYITSSGNIYRLRTNAVGEKP
ncbi:MAG: SMP-30/gluconolactonase/LRE family protein [Acidobacteriaceae bacterium]|nr:SMP-30/gluconolactonase/LRE family protein [Acidobacteriaceae bacterium]